MCQHWGRLVVRQAQEVGGFLENELAAKDIGLNIPLFTGLMSQSFSQKNNLCSTHPAVSVCDDAEPVSDHEHGVLHLVMCWENMQLLQYGSLLITC